MIYMLEQILQWRYVNIRADILFSCKCYWRFINVRSKSGTLKPEGQRLANKASLQYMQPLMRYDCNGCKNRIQVYSCVKLGDNPTERRICVYCEHAFSKVTIQVCAQWLTQTRLLDFYCCGTSAWWTVSR